jgi:hypothetical protein
LVHGPAVRRATISDSNEHNLGYAEICAELAERFGTGFRVEVTGSCVTMVANLEGGIQVLITDCEAALSPIERHRDGGAAGFYVGLHPAEPDTEGASQVDVHRAYACSETTPPTAEAIGNLVQEALGHAMSQPKKLFGGEEKVSRP